MDVLVAGSADPFATCEIPIAGGKVAIIDAMDKPLIEIYSRSWGLCTKGYAQCRAVIDGKLCYVMMHRIIMGFPPKPWQVDHIDLNKLNNRRCNLRLCTNTQNQGNRAKQVRLATSRFKGVDRRSFLKSKQFRAQIHIKGRCVNLGSFEFEEDAARAYDRAALDYFGEFARLNFPIEQIV